MATVKKTELNKDKLARKISEGYGSVKSLMSGYSDYIKSRQAATSKRMDEQRAKAGIRTAPSAAALAATMARTATAAPARSRAATIAPLKPMSFISQPSAPKAAPAARPVAKTAARPATSTAAPAAKPMARPATAIAKADTLLPRSVSTEMQPMAKREVKIDTTSKRGNLLQRLGERLKSRQLARASKSVGTPMKSTTSVPSTPTPSAPQTESGQKLSAVGKAMLDKYMSKKYMGGGKMEYMGGGKMKKYAKGGMIEKEGMKPKGKMDKKKAFMEMIAKLKAKKK